MSINRGRKPWKAKNSEQALPLYSVEKPRGSLKIKKKKMLTRGLLISAILYLVYYLLFGTEEQQIAKLPKDIWRGRQEEVRQVFLEGYKTYEQEAWGKDEFHPILGTSKNMGPKPLGWMIVDSLDTLMLMNCSEEVARAREWVRNVLDYDFDYEVSVFETTIRMLGGLLSAYHLSGDDLYLDKAMSLGNRLISGFKTPSGISYSSINLHSGEGVKNHVDNGATSTAETTTLQLEFKYLSKLVGEAYFWKTAEHAMEVVELNKALDGLVPIYIHPDTGTFQGNLIRFGSRGDSHYEYLLKQYLQTNKLESVYWDMHRESIEGVKKHLVRKSVPSGLTFLVELENGIGGGASNKMDHLACFYAGLAALGATEGLTYEEARNLPWWDQSRESDLNLGKDLTHTCYRMYHDTDTGLSPEIAVFNTEPGSSKDFYIKPFDKHNLQRPETVESLFYLYRITRDEKYRDWGYEIFQNFVKYTKFVNSNGHTSYTCLDDVTKIMPPRRDNMESFWFGETLKYLYLLFDEDEKIPLDKYVFNTEAHPLPKFDPGPKFKTGWRRLNPFLSSALENYIPPKESSIYKGKIPSAAPANKPLEEQAKDAIKNGA